jgi:rhodanese-related sulfurtransferase
MIVILLIFVVLLSAVIYNRYVSVPCVPCMETAEISKADVVIVDIRDYQDSAKDPIAGSLTIPTAYLKRYSAEIPKKALYIVSTDSVEKNLGIRYLHKNGFIVLGYTLTDCSCS